MNKSHLIRTVASKGIHPEASFGVAAAVEPVDGFAVQGHLLHGERQHNRAPSLPVGGETLSERALVGHLRSCEIDRCIEVLAIGQHDAFSLCAQHCIGRDAARDSGRLVQKIERVGITVGNDGGHDALTAQIDHSRIGRNSEGSLCQFLFLCAIGSKSRDGWLGVIIYIMSCLVIHLRAIVHIHHHHTVFHIVIHIIFISNIYRRMGRHRDVFRPPCTIVKSPFKLVQNQCHCTRIVG